MTRRLAVIGLLVVGATSCWMMGPLGSEAGEGADADADTDADADADADSDADADTDADTDFDCSGDGVWYDATSNLCWRDPPCEGWMFWGTAVSHCNNLVHGGHSDWRLPNIDELISLIRGCVDGDATGDLSPSACAMTPSGCAATDSCSGVSNCSWCSKGNGPTSGCYWDPMLIGNCTWYWSSSSRAADSDFAWSVSFRSGYVGNSYKAYSHRARCVRDP